MTLTFEYKKSVLRFTVPYLTVYYFIEYHVRDTNQSDYQGFFNEENQITDPEE